MQEIRDAKAKFPENPVFEAAAVEMLAAADPARTGAAIYAEVMLSGSDLIPDKPDYDTARTAIAAHLLEDRTAAARCRYCGAGGSANRFRQRCKWRKPIFGSAGPT